MNIPAVDLFTACFQFSNMNNPVAELFPACFRFSNTNNPVVDLFPVCFRFSNMNVSSSAVLPSSSVSSKPRPAHCVPVQHSPLSFSGAGGVSTYDGGKYSHSPRFWAVFLSRMEIWIIAGLRQLCFQFKPSPFRQTQQTHLAVCICCAW
jgi:hypothetical protein